MAGLSGNDAQTSSSTTTSAPQNPAVDAATTTIANQINTEAGKSPFTYGQSLYVPNGDTTTQGQNMALSAANNPGYTSSVNGAIGSIGDMAAGKSVGVDAPGYQTVRQNIANTTLKNVASQFTNSGRFGGGSYVTAATQGLGNALANADLNQYNTSIQQQQQAAQLLPSLFQGAQLPASIYSAVGNAQDTNANAVRQGDYDLASRTANAKINQLGQIGSILSGTANGSGTTSTTTNSTPSTPWWQSLLGLGLTAL